MIPRGYVMDPAVCQTCGAAIAEYEWRQDLYLAEIDLYDVRHFPVPGSQHYTWRPCGHTHYGTITIREATA